MGNFSNIPDTFWFTLVTMTNVGYGDEVPLTPLGSLIASICALSGLLIGALVVPVIIINFHKHYKSSKKNTASEKRRKVGKNTNKH